MPDFAAFQEQLAAITSCVLKISHAMGGDSALADNLPGWTDLKDKPRQVLVHEGRICLVCVLFGPSGAGKSTLFKLLTTIDVPSGERRRPMTHNCAVAVPAPLQGVVDVTRLFPGHSMLPLTDVEMLKDAQRSGDELFYAYYEENDTASAWLVLADVPDFNTVVRRNWSKAEKMLGRAETVVFVVYPEAYKDEAVIDQLLKCASKAGHLAYLVTKLPPEDAADTAREIWQDVLDHARHAPEFQRLRSDGGSIADFLDNAAVYYSPRNSSPALSDVKPLNPTTPDFRSLLKGQDAAAIYWSNLLEVSEQGIASAARLSQQAVDLIRELEDKRRRAEQRITDIGARIAGSQFPAGELVELIISTVKESRPRWLRTVTLPFAMGARMFLSVRKLIAKFRKTDRNAILKERQHLERQRLDDAVEVLLEWWRVDFPSEAATGLLQAGRCRTAAQQFRQQELPRVRGDWKEAMRGDVREWAGKHPWFGSLIGTLSEMLVLFGGAALVLDLAISGGIFGAVGQLGIAGAAGAGSIGAGTVMKMFEELKLKEILIKADASWRDQRSAELAAHLREHLAFPLFLQSWTQTMNTLNEAQPKQCLLACQNVRDQWMSKTRH
ncbi:hypothetical protein SAMN05660653_01220 [Desulfonatronum thiosulfatophilum]|uniref:50S ribosome-binding GTPase n=1 Tax=Desulfonatronum thiosulfatophilum TaxID=617002 RepID=A0A1G6BYM5_9BACT|nr:hypothetical protein SAMN05660653_01220 [Desulfonatronum thiosulfatophilum]